MKPSPLTRRASGFSLVEVLVALVVLSIGLLGIAKMQALGLSSTSIAGRRALAATEADSLAAAMHENRAYWTITAASTTQSFTGVPAVVAACTQGAGPCQPTQLAAYDLWMWASDLYALLPNYTGSVACSNTTPVTCLVQITWYEKTLAINANGQAAATVAAGTNLPTYTLFVEP
ncbi:MAG: type IV pilus modification protein PilV [Steroidobacteraceae bacterium]